MAVLNRNPRPQKVLFDWKAEKVADGLSKREARFESTVYTIRDLWQKKDLAKTDTALSIEVGSQDVVLLRLHPVQ
jgi:alpha-galactosidase